jgi:hypothetical protein
VGEERGDEGREIDLLAFGVDAGAFEGLGCQRVLLLGDLAFELEVHRSV